ncbi:CENP-B N-terminal DNA-binding domain [Popillia japonica]|uniref:CENP-B N-terminal DNA-binding domain n=1 Tax=Popillia japonica TaxID=7064 RepID=A0AAW1I908_POPJA
MVRTYKKKKSGAQWTVQEAEGVINAIKEDELTITKAAQQYGVPKTCLLQRIKSNNTTASRNDNYKHKESTNSNSLEVEIQEKNRKPSKKGKHNVNVKRVKKKLLFVNFKA